MEQVKRRFKVGDLVIPVDPQKSKLPECPRAVVEADWHYGKPVVTVDYYPEINPVRARRYEWVFTKWSPTSATDPGVDEYEEIMKAQELCK